MQNPIFLILIVTRNRESEAVTIDLFSKSGTVDSKGSNDPRVSFKRTKYTYNLNHETPDTSGPEDESH